MPYPSNDEDGGYGSADDSMGYGQLEEYKGGEDEYRKKRSTYTQKRLEAIAEVKRFDYFFA